MPERMSASISSPLPPNTFHWPKGSEGGGPLFLPPSLCAGEIAGCLLLPLPLSLPPRCPEGTGWAGGEGGKKGAVGNLYPKERKKETACSYSSPVPTTTSARFQDRSVGKKMF